MTTTMRQCIGSTRYGIEAHEAPQEDFPKQPSQKEGLGRMCRSHWNQYTAGLARDRKARQAADPFRPLGDILQPPKPETTPKTARGRKPAPPKTAATKRVVDGTERQKGEIAELERRVAEAGGAGSEAGQALLEEAAADSAAHRDGGRRSRRAAAAPDPVAEEQAIA